MKAITTRNLGCSAPVFPAFEGGYCQHEINDIFSESLVRSAIDAVINVGIFKVPLHYDGVFPDPDDRVFFEVAWSMYQEAHETYLVTGNIKHYPKEEFVITPRQMLDMIEPKP